MGLGVDLREENNPIDPNTPAEKPESRIVDITDQFLGKALIFTQAKKART
jgi:hypothetical protein